MTRLGAIVQQALEQLEWQDEISLDEEQGTSQVRTEVQIDGQLCELFIDTHEATDSIAVFFYLPFRVKAGAYAEACQFINAVNSRTRHGHLEILRDSGRLRMVVSADVEGAAPTGAFVVQMIHLGVNTLATWMGDLAAVALSNRSAEELLAVADREPERDQERDLDQDPEEAIATGLTVTVP